MTVYKYTSLTCVLYERGDIIGKLLAYSSLLPVMMFVHQSSKVYCSRELHELMVLVGLAAGEAINRTLKNIIQQSRPLATCQALNVCHSHGMPSSHTQFMFFALVVLSMVSIRYKHPHWVATALSYVEVMVLAALSVVVGVSRIYLGYHTLHQVIAGGLLGIALGSCWTWLTYRLAPVYKVIAAWPACKALSIKDTLSQTHQKVE